MEKGTGEQGTNNVRITPLLLILLQGGRYREVRLYFETRLSQIVVSEKFVE